MLSFDDLTIGQRIELGSRRITKEEIIAFARDWDPQPFHIDEEAGRNSFLGGLCASGWHTAVILHRLTVDSLFGKINVLGSPGLDEIKWNRPVFPGDTLTASVELIDKRVSASRSGVGLLQTASVIHNQDGVQVMTIRGWVMIGLRDSTQ